MDKKTRREKNTEHQRTYRERHPERITASNKAYYDKHKDSLGKRRKESRADSGQKPCLQGEIIREHRRSLGLSQQKYAEALGITQATLSNWERCFAPVNADIVEAAFPGMGKKLKWEK